MGRGSSRISAEMHLGFNTDVRVGEQAYHVQTEDRGPQYGRIDTAVYVRGRVVHKVSTSYTELEGGMQASEDVRRARVEYQHRHIIEALRGGSLVVEDAAPHVPSAPPRVERPGVVIQVLNANSWLAAGKCDLQLQVQRRDATHEGAGGARLRVFFEGIADSPEIAAHCDAEGRAEIRFPMPASAAAGAVLVVQAASDVGDGEIRFNLRARKKTPAGSV